MTRREDAKSRRVTRWRRVHSSCRRGLRRLGPLEYMLLGLVVLGIAVTVAMAIVNP
jgi:hypothetical protein